MDGGGGGSHPAIGGTVELTTKVTVEPSPDFIAKVKTEVRSVLRGVQMNGNGGMMNANGPGSLGQSSPDAMAPSGVGHN